MQTINIHNSWNIKNHNSLGKQYSISIFIFPIFFILLQRSCYEINTSCFTGWTYDTFIVMIPKTFRHIFFLFFFLNNCRLWKKKLLTLLTSMSCNQSCRKKLMVELFVCFVNNDGKWLVFITLFTTSLSEIWVGYILA